MNRFLCALIAALPLAAQARRVVILKMDGLPQHLIERYAAEHRLPNIERVFGAGGVRVDSFYVRGMSLSAPSWSMLDTGRHLEIHGNAEYDRYTLRSHDYLNFFPLYRDWARKTRADMPGTELLDEQGVPLLIDRFPVQERYQSFQLFQRGARLKSLSEGLKTKLKAPVKELFDEWQTGFNFSSAISLEMERELMAKLKDPKVRYLDLYSGDYDHVAHLADDATAQLHVIEAIDAQVGRVWAAIEASPLAASTVLVLVSDHGMNTSDGVFSQGYSLVDYFASAAGGGHHVINNRHTLSEFKLMGLDPFVSEVTTASQDSYYMAGQSGDYPTAVLDVDGNERANVSLRSNALNIAHILLTELIRKQIRGRERKAAIDALFATLNRERARWKANIDGLEQELIKLRADDEVALRRAAELRHLTKAQVAQGLQAERWRILHRVGQDQEDQRAYAEYIATLRRLLALDPADFDPGKFRIEDLIPRRALGEVNDIHDLRNYAVAAAPGGLVVAADGSLDWRKSFRTVDYLSALAALRVRNNVQKEVGPQPVDFIAVAAGPDAVWLYRDEEHQALIERRGNRLRYTPVAHLTQDEFGALHYQSISWRAGLPLEMYEDPFFDVAARDQWLSEWHTEAEWFQAVHRTRYSNGVIGVMEQVLNECPPGDAYRDRRRALRRADLLVFANDHWNFNVRGFNPGGNHGSFLQVSTHSVLMFAGGRETGVARGLRISTPYDSLSLTPTILSIMGMPDATMPGPVIPISSAPPSPGSSARYRDSAR